jgi:tRNA A-37 threonylcarbamoyl transferase component Bud32
MDALQTLTIALAGRYTIEREIGRGGMATVYLARDVRHERRVALKVLDPELAAVLGGERFLSEIRVTANLQHPNLLPLFDSGEAEGLLFYVMPFVEGETLRAKLEREKQLAVEEALRIACGVVSALDYAHRHGVIHRDLKPENILLHDGQPLVADFGIALAVSNAGGARVTQTGISLGTPQYMSPEQATGDRGVDGRTDIYSLGAVTYEMLAGEPPHIGQTAQAIFARLITEEPRPLSAVRRHVPAHVNDAVMCALEKLPADRFAHARDFADALQGRAVALPPTSTAAVVQRASRRSRILPWIAAAAAGVTAIVAGIGWSRAAHEPAPSLLIPIAFPESAAPHIVFARGRFIALSHDGSQMAWAGAASASDDPGLTATLFLRSFSAPGLRGVDGFPNAYCPAFSPDGASLLFVQGPTRRVYRMPIGTGAPVLIADSSGSCPAWGPDGTIIYEHIRGGRPLVRVSENGGRPSLIVSPDSGSGDRFTTATFLPDSRYAIVTILPGIRSAGERQLARVRLSDGRIDRLGLRGINGRYSRTGHLVYATIDGDLMAVGLSRDGTVRGTPQQVASGVAVQPGGSAQFDVSDDGTLVLIAGPVTGKRRVVSVDSAGRSTALFESSKFIGWPRVSPDGRRVALQVGESMVGPWDVWLLDLQSGSLSRLTSGGGGNRTVGWTADGAKVVYLANERADQPNSFARRFVVTIPWDRSGPPDTVFRGSDLQDASVDARGGYIAVAVGSASDLAIGTRIIVVALDSSRRSRAWPAPAASASESHPRISPDGRWLAFASDESGRMEIYATSLAVAGPRVQISTRGGTEPMWDRSGSRLFYRGATRMMRATLTLSPTLAVVRRDSLFGDGYSHLGLSSADVFPDGRRFVMLVPEPVSFQTQLITNWPQRLASPRR